LLFALYSHYCCGCILLLLYNNNILP